MPLLEDNADWLLLTVKLLFYQTKQGWDVELQNTHKVFFKFRCFVMQVSTPNAQLGLRSELLDWYWCAKSVPYGSLLFDLSPHTDDRLNCCRNSGSIRSNFYVPEWLGDLKCLDHESNKIFYSLNGAIFFPTNTRINTSNWSKRDYLVSLQMHSKSAQWKPAEKRHC